MSTETDISAAELNLKILTEQFKRTNAAREMAELGIEKASPADVEAWLAYTPQQRRRASLMWAILNASYA